MLQRRGPQAQLGNRVIDLRWAIPVSLAIIGMGYALFEHVWIQAESLSSPSVLRAILLLAIANPLFFWLVVNGATRIENSRLYEQAHRRALYLETASLVGQRMTSLLDLDTLLTEVVTFIRAQFSYYHANLFNDYWNWPGHAVAFDGGTENRIVGVPLTCENQIIGGVDIVNDPVGRAFDGNDI